MPSSRLALLALLASGGLLAGCASRSGGVSTVPGSSDVRGDSRDDARGSTASRLGIPPGHLPAPGSCRVWLPGVPPGQQKSALGGKGKGTGKGRGQQAAVVERGDCARVLATAPAGSWVVFRPTADKKVVHVREVDGARVGVISRIRIFDLATGAFLREERP